MKKSKFIQKIICLSLAMLICFSTINFIGCGSSDKDGREGNNPAKPNEPLTNIVEDDFNDNPAVIG